MDKNQVLARVAAIVSTLGETGGSPESMLYIFCDMNMEDYQILRNILLQAKLVKVSGNYVTLTPEGKATAARLNQHLESLKGQ